MVDPCSGHGKPSASANTKVAELNIVARTEFDPLTRAQEAIAKVNARLPEAEAILRHMHGYGAGGPTPEAFDHDRHLLAAKLQALAEAERFAGFAAATSEPPPKPGARNESNP